MLTAIRNLILCILYGAAGTALVRYLYVQYDLMGRGYGRGSMSLETLLVDHVELQKFVIWGAIGGAILGGLLMLAAMIGGVAAWMSRPKRGSTSDVDPDALIRADSARRADDYLSSRRHDTAPSR